MIRVAVGLVLVVLPVLAAVTEGVDTPLTRGVVSPPGATGEERRSVQVSPGCCGGAVVLNPFIKIVEEIKLQVVVSHQLDTTTSGGKLVFHVFGALAEFERDLIRERTQAGLLAARARGRLGGRPRALDPRKVQIAQQLYNDKNNAIADICRTLRISRATLYKYLKTETGAPT